MTETTISVSYQYEDGVTQGTINKVKPTATMQLLVDFGATLATLRDTGLKKTQKITREIKYESED